MKGFNSMDSVSGYDLSSLPFIDDHSHPYIVTPEGDRYTALDTFLGVGGACASGRHALPALGHPHARPFPGL
jgi:hypothetical protein